jgi:DNA-binding winged helix-turn-helix (wHTH) protein
MKNALIHFDSVRRRVTVGDRSTYLQEKNWQVLRMLADRAGQVVSRVEIVDAVWQGNYQTGEKGLNQALWILRSALGDDARHPKYLRTVPRIGYQWIHPATDPANESRRPRTWGKKTAVAASALILMTTALAYLKQIPSRANGDPKSLSAHHAVNVSLQNKDIVIEMSDGCVGILKGSGEKILGSPLLSSDGIFVAFTVRESASCRLVTVDLKNGERQDFGKCPLDII